MRQFNHHNRNAKIVKSNLQNIFVKFVTFLIIKLKTKKFIIAMPVVYVEMEAKKIHFIVMIVMLAIQKDQCITANLMYSKKTAQYV